MERYAVISYNTEFEAKKIGEYSTLEEAKNAAINRMEKRFEKEDARMYVWVFQVIIYDQIAQQVIWGTFSSQPMPFLINTLLPKALAR